MLSDHRGRDLYFVINMNAEWTTNTHVIKIVGVERGRANGPTTKVWLCASNFSPDVE